MNINQFKDYCLAKPNTTCDFPFDHKTLVFRVGGKMFALTNIEQEPCKVNLKCDPVTALMLRQKHKCITPGYHMNKKHWNTVEIENPDLKTKTVKDLIDHSYELVASKLPKKKI